MKTLVVLAMSFGCLLLASCAEDEECKCLGAPAGSLALSNFEAPGDASAGLFIMRGPDGITEMYLQVTANGMEGADEWNFGARVDFGPDWAMLKSLVSSVPTSPTDYASMEYASVGLNGELGEGLRITSMQWELCEPGRLTFELLGNDAEVIQVVYEGKFQNNCECAPKCVESMCGSEPCFICDPVCGKDYAVWCSKSAIRAELGFELPSFYGAP